MTVRKADEIKTAKLSKERALLNETLANQKEGEGTFAEKPEPALTFLSNPWKV